MCTLYVFEVYEVYSREQKFPSKFQNFQKQSYRVRISEACTTVLKTWKVTTTENLPKISKNFFKRPVASRTVLEMPEAQNPTEEHLQKIAKYPYKMS